MKKELINNHVPYFSGEQTASVAIKSFADNAFAELPVVQDNLFLGFVTKTELSAVKGNVKLKNIVKQNNEIPRISQKIDILQATALFLKNTEFNLMPVLDKKFFYIGCLEKKYVYEEALRILGFNKASLWYEVFVSIPKQNAVSAFVAFLEKYEINIISLVVKEKRDDALIISINCDAKEGVDIKKILVWGGYKVLFSSFYQESVEDELLKNRVEELFRYLEV